MNKYAFFLGCNIPARVSQYETAGRMVLKRVGVKLVDIRQFNCCGYPLRNSDSKAYLLSAVRNLALAEEQNLDLLVLCQCCLGSLKKAAQLMTEDGAIQDEVRNILDSENLRYRGNVKIKHLLTVLHHDIGIEAIQKQLNATFKDLNIAVQYGCHGLRPSSVTQFDDPSNPTIFDDLVTVTGAESVDWPLKLDCCGAPALGIDDDLSNSLAVKKILGGKKAGAQYICTVCPYCHLQFDTVQAMIIKQKKLKESLPAILYPQLLGLSMGIDAELLGLNQNQLEIGNIRSFLCNEE